MNFYEGLFLLDPAEAAANWEELKNYVFGILERLGGEIIYSEKWPDKKLAYEIKGRFKGTYFLIFFKAKGEMISLLRQEINIAERILRVMILRKDNALEEIETLKEKNEKTLSTDSYKEKKSNLDENNLTEKPDNEGKKNIVPASSFAAASAASAADDDNDDDNDADEIINEEVKSSTTGSDIDNNKDDTENSDSADEAEEEDLETETESTTPEEKDSKEEEKDTDALKKDADE